MSIIIHGVIGDGITELGGIIGDIDLTILGLLIGMIGTIVLIGAILIMVLVGDLVGIIHTIMVDFIIMVIMVGIILIIME
ncbi:hypothetical protein BWG23_11025 [Flavobacterium oreochromis]|nr:hypothetical protein BWG23_11025 [Flavobacterium oreochromis]